ncbi:MULTISPECIES: hypothetical protein [unclassified Microbacterium]|uniref:hypothetical protein n=1 Tax=unclassified Microbacterium TaxID=2609290 RepID=UPI002882F214|nr:MULTISPECIES: hypothetical protein [unclassified Microbacterium]
MVNLKSEVHGKGATKEVNLVVLAYDNRVAKKDGVVTTRYLDARVHPGDRRAPGDTNLALVTKDDPKAPGGKSNSARYSANQFEAIKQAAGDNVTDLVDRDGTVSGKIYGVKADLLINKGEVVINTKTLDGPGLSIADENGKDIRTRIFDSMAEAKAARAAAKEAAAAEKSAAAEAEVDAPDAAREPVLVGAGAPDAPVASSDQPELG